MLKANLTSNMKTKCKNFDQCGGYYYPPYKMCLLCHRLNKAFGSSKNPGELIFAEYLRETLNKNYGKN